MATGTQISQQWIISKWHYPDQTPSWRDILDLYVHSINRSYSQYMVIVMVSLPERRDIVILGASYAGLGVAQYTLKHIIPRLMDDVEVRAEYRVVLVDPSSKFFVRHLAPRALASPNHNLTDKLFLDRASAFAQYGSAVEIIQGSAVAWDSQSRRVTVKSCCDEPQDPGTELEPAQTRHLVYHALVLATGSKPDEPIFGLQGGPHVEPQEALFDMSIRLQQNLDHIVIFGGGPTAVETAGELGQRFNLNPDHSSAVQGSPRVKITIITRSKRLLPALQPSIGKAAQKGLGKLGVTVLTRTKSVYATPFESSMGQMTHILLSDGQQMVANIAIDAIGVRPMSDYIPAHLKNEQGYVMTDPTTRVIGAGPRVYAIGDIDARGQNSIADIRESTPTLLINLTRDVQAAKLTGNDVAPQKHSEWQSSKNRTMTVPIGRRMTVGVIFGWRMPGWMLGLIRGRVYREEHAREILQGDRWTAEYI